VLSDSDVDDYVSGFEIEADRGSGFVNDGVKRRGKNIIDVVLIIPSVSSDPRREIWEIRQNLAFD
jgi:hypothetical protein